MKLRRVEISGYRSIKRSVSLILDAVDANVDQIPITPDKNLAPASYKSHLMITARPGRHARNRQLLAVGAILFLASAYFYQDPEWNGNSRLDLTRALVEQGSAEIDSYKSRGIWTTGDLAFYGGHFYTDKAIGTSLFAVPFYFLLLKLGMTSDSTFVKHFLTAVVMGGAFTANGLAMFLIAKRLARDSWTALVATLAVSLGTMLWPYSAVYYGHVPAAAFLTIAFYLLRLTRERASPVPHLRLFWAGLTMGLAFITEYPTALIIAGLLIYAVYLMRSRRPAEFTQGAIAGSLGALIPLSLLLAYNFHVYGTPMATGYAFEVLPAFQKALSGGLMGIGFPNLTNLYRLTVDPQFGIFWLSPVLLLSPVGYYIALKTSKYRAEGLLCLYTIVAMVVMDSGLFFWWGGFAFGPRYLIPALSFFIVPLALIPKRLTQILALLAAVSTFQMMIPLMGQIQPVLLYNANQDMFYTANGAFRGFSLLYNDNFPLIISHFETGGASWMLGTELGIPYWLRAPALMAAEALLILRFRRAGAPAASNTE